MLRRDALRLIGAAGLAGCSAPAGPSPTSVPTTTASARGTAPRGPVVVVGAGLAGLTVATDLVARGFDVTILEAQDVVGGRIATVRKADWHGGGFVELGARHVVGDPDLLELIRLAGARTASVDREDPPRVVRFSGGRRTVGVAEDNDVVPGLTADEEALGSIGRRRKYLPLVDTIDPRFVGVLDPSLIAFDRLSLRDALVSRGASAGYVEAMADAFAMGEGADRFGALGVVRELACIATERRLENGGRVVNGTDRLPRGLAERLGARVRCNVVVRRIEPTAGGFSVAYEDHGVPGRISAARVVVAVPFGALRHVVITAPISAEKRRAIATIPSASVVRAFVHTNGRPWTSRGESGTAETDLPIGRVRDESQSATGEGSLGIYLSGAAARDLAHTARREDVLVEMIERVHPGTRAVTTDVVFKAWDEDRFAGGAYAWFQPGQLSELGPHIAKAEGAIHFAGDHTSYRPGFMHGAVASAKRVVAEILAASR